ncbi:KR domain-containing protein [Aspergillus leporis]|uniref:KR domain-containing protein n=1 Tax=Aspergillus leporis TaxID=41062 RepID=A0A5N5WSB9_9EURO|nr:KR domain-containing protein [Aspergillus leporis]
MDRSLLESVVSDDFTSLASMLQHSQCTLWVTRGAAMASDDPWKALHLGLLRTLRNENHSRRFVSLDLDPLRDPWTAQSCDAIVNVLNAVDASHEKEFEYAEHDGIIHVPRTFSDLSPSDKEDLVVLEPFQNETRLVRLDVQTPGLLDSLHFKLCSADEAWSSELPEDWVEIEPRAFGLNFRDIMVAMGQLETNRVMGFECAGVVTRLGKAARTGAGGLAIGDRAAIILAQLVGAEVFTTAGTHSKRSFLMDKFKLASDHVFSSRDSGFVEGIKVCTNGKGVDVVVNSLAGPLLQNSFDCLANFGRFVEIGKKDIEQNSRLGMSTFARNVSFSSIDILYWEEAKSAETIDLVGPISEYPMSAIEKAFRTMQSGQHVGKLVVAAAGTDMIPVRRGTMPVALKPDASYLIVGGLGGIGRRICEWMVDHGARHLLILSRSGRTDPFVTGLQERACVVRIYSCDVADESQLHAVLQQCHEDNMPPIRGIIQAAMVLKDALVSQMTADDFHVALRPKVQGSWNLHKISSEVDLFVMLSSLVGVMGGAGQANYAAAGVFQDALAQHRVAQGKPAVTIDLGMVKSIGYVAETDLAVAKRLARIGYQPMHKEEALALTTDADWMQEARFAGIKYRDPLKDDRGGALSSSHPADEDSVRARLNRASTEKEATALVVQAMGHRLVTMFGLTESEMSATQTLASVGVDSRVAIELRNWITAQLNVDISVFELMEGRTIAEVAEVVVKKYGARSKV